jgi:hypothetical protein
LANDLIFELRGGALSPGASPTVVSNRSGIGIRWFTIGNRLASKIATNSSVVGINVVNDFISLGFPSGQAEQIANFFTLVHDRSREFLMQRGEGFALRGEVGDLPIFDAHLFLQQVDDFALN